MISYLVYRKIRILNVIRYSRYLKLYLSILICFFAVYSTKCIQQAKLLTNSSNKHNNLTNVIKLSQDYRTVYSISRGLNSSLKIWNFNIISLELRQQIFLSYNIRFAYAESLFSWNNGEKLFVGTNSLHIYTLNSSDNLYITPPIIVSFAGSTATSALYTVWVNTPGNKVYLATDKGCKQFDFVSPNWIQNTPTYLTNLGTNIIFTFIKPINNQQKLIIFEYPTLKIIILKQNGSIYSPHQTILTGISASDVRNCYVSTNQLFICCYGGTNVHILTQFNCYKLNNITNLYQNITLPNNMTYYTYFNYMNKNQIYTTTQIFTKTLYKYKFTNSSGIYQYTLINSYYFNGQTPTRIAYQRQNSNLQLISTIQGNIYIIYSLKCYNKVELYNCLLCLPDSTICYLCKSNFVLVSGICVCPFPLKQVSGFCANLTDRGLVNCLNGQKLVNNTIVCLFCSITSNQIVSNNLCACRSGYHDPNSTGTCTDICGDGLVFQSQCDDFNTFNGDGCDQFCQVQPGSQCNIINGLTVCKSQSLLKYSQPIQISRDKTGNKAILKLKVLNSKSLLPFQINKSDFIPQSNYISLFVSNNQNLSQVRFEKLVVLQVDQNYTLYLQFQFIKDFILEGSSARIQLNYQNSKYSNYTQKIQFLMEGSNMPLYWSQNLNSYKSISIFNLIIVIFSVIILLVGLFSPKFIGLYMILTLQLIFFSQLLIQKISNWPMGFSYLQNLKFSTGYNDILQLSKILPQRTLQIKFQNLNIKKHVIQNLNISFFLIFLAISISSFWLFYRLFYQKQIAQLKQSYRNLLKVKQKQQISQKVTQLQTKIQKTNFWNEIFYNTISQLSFWTILPFFSALSAYFLIKDKYVKIMNSPFEQKFIRKIGFFIIFFIITSFLLVCLNNFKNIWIPTKKWIELQKRKKQQIVYKRALFLYLMLMAFLIFFFNDSIYFLNLPTSLLALLFQIIFIVLLIIIHPYRQSLKIHTISLYINHLAYTLFLAVINIINFVQNLDQIIILMFGFFVVGSSFMTIILSVIRLYYQYRYGQSLEIKLEKQREQKEAQQKLREKQKLQRKINDLERLKKNQMTQKQKQRAENGYLFENQKQQEEKIQLLNWLNKKNWSQDMKQQYYYNNYAEKPLSWLKTHDNTKYQKRLQELNKKQKLQTSGQKHQNKQKQYNQPQYSNFLTSIKKSHQLQIKNLQIRYKEHNICMLQNPGYNMKIMQQNLQKSIRQQYELKD